MDNKQGQTPGPERLALERRFHEHEAEGRLVNYRRGAVLAIIFVMGGLILDIIVYRFYLHQLLMLRLACCSLIGGLLAFLYWPSMRKNATLLMHLIAVIPMITLDLMLVELAQLNELGKPGDGAASVYYAGLNLNMVGTVLILRWRFRDGVINASVAIGGYLAVALALGTNPVATTTATFFLIVTALFACIGLFFYNRLRFAEFCLKEEVVAQQEELTEKNRKLEELDQAKMQFFANINHELRTPLTLILAPVEKMRASNAVRNDARLSEMVDSLEDNGKRLLRLINDLLDLVRLDSGEMQNRPERFQPGVFIDGLGRNLRPMAERKRINLTWTSTCEPDREVYLDRDHLEKIVLNLAVNALKFTPPSGRVSLTVGIEMGQLTLEVADNGAGMKEEQVKAAFERFWQADTSIRKKHRGVGIGLALVKSLVEALRGTVKIDSVFGEGTTFTIRVPLTAIPADKPEPEEPEDVHAEADPIEKLYQEARLAGAFSQMDTEPVKAPPMATFGIDGTPVRERVLIAEDESGLRRFLRGELEDLGCEVIEACDGGEAWELARQYEPELILLDYMMPEIDGITLTQKLRANEGTSQIPIILVTANADETPRLSALEAGVSDFLTKPFPTTELRVRIRNLLDRQSYQRQLGLRNRELASALDELRENEARLLQAEKLSSLGRMSAGIVHEVNNPLNYTKTALHALQMYGDDVPAEEKADFLDMLGDAQEGVERVINIVTDLRAFTKGETSVRQRIRFASVIEMARRLVSGDLQDIDFKVDMPDDLIVVGNENQLCQVFVNLIQNAAQFLEGTRERGDEPEISITAQETPSGKVLVVLRDNGCGIKPEDLKNIFDPFFTKRDVGEGMGLGLSICHRIIESHGGRIDVESVPSRFTEFSITLPGIQEDEDEDVIENDESEDDEQDPNVVEQATTT